MIRETLHSESGIHSLQTSTFRSEAPEGLRGLRPAAKNATRSATTQMALGSRCTDQ